MLSYLSFGLIFQLRGISKHRLVLFRYHKGKSFLWKFQINPILLSHIFCRVMREKGKKNHINTRRSENHPKDEIYQVNGIAYLESDLKLAHLRILMAIISHLQNAIHYKISRGRRNTPIPTAYLPPKGEVGQYGPTRTIEIPVKDFHMGRNNGARLRLYLSELQTTHCIFPERCRYPGLIAGFTFPAYSTSVQIHILDEMINRLLLTEEGYSYYSHSSALSLTNKYTVRLYWMICSWRGKGGFVITLDNFKRILSLTEGYDRYDNIVSRVIKPAQQELQERFPIWFIFRSYDTSGYKRLVFKVKIRLTEEERSQKTNEARDICFGLLSELGGRTDTISGIFHRLEYEDLRPFMNKLVELSGYIKNNPSIKDRDSYIKSSLQQWFDDWSQRYQELSEDHEK